MARFSKGRNALMISYRSGAAFPYREMVQEWTGAWVHNSEFEPKQPQLEPKPVGADPQGLQHAFPARTEFAVQDILPNNPFTTNTNTTLNVSYRQNYNTTNQSDTGLTKVARDAYAATANKAANGTPSQFWVQRFIEKVTITIYPLPNATAASNFLSVYYVKRIQDAGAYTNASDTPFRFIPCMISGLSYYLSMKFAPQRTQEMKLLYEDELARALSEDGSAASTFITPKTYYPNI